MFKFISLFSLIFVLSGCYYSFKDGCWYAPQYANCVQKNIKSDVQRLYKVDGQPVSEEQKINDIKACGAVPDEYGNFLRAIRKEHPKDNGYSVIKPLGNCLWDKGYKNDNVYN